MLRASRVTGLVAASKFSVSVHPQEAVISIRYNNARYDVEDNDIVVAGDIPAWVDGGRIGSCGAIISWTRTSDRGIKGSEITKGAHHKAAVGINRNIVPGDGARRVDCVRVDIGAGEIGVEAGERVRDDPGGSSHETDRG